VLGFCLLVVLSYAVWPGYGQVPHWFVWLMNVCVLGAMANTVVALWHRRVRRRLDAELVAALAQEQVAVQAERMRRANWSSAPPSVPPMDRLPPAARKAAPVPMVTAPPGAAVDFVHAMVTAAARAQYWMAQPPGRVVVLVDEAEAVLLQGRLVPNEPPGGGAR